MTYNKFEELFLNFEHVSRMRYRKFSGPERLTSEMVAIHPMGIVIFLTNEKEQNQVGLLSNHRGNPVRGLGAVVQWKVQTAGKWKLLAGCKDGKGYSTVRTVPVSTQCGQYIQHICIF